MIDQATVSRILDAADIVDVVSDFVQLKRRGANWIGLCPFHNDRNPSFYVSRAKNICKCFSCGKGGSPVNFIMEHQQMSYVEALRYLAAKYHIEIMERELTDEERAAQTERESMMVLNEWACKFFEHQLHETRDGQEIGMAYLRERGFSDATIKNFHLGYSPEGVSTLYDAAIKQGYSHDLLVAVGLCIANEHGGARDRFRGRIIFPITNVAGKVVAFAGRTLRKEDKAKYVNSPESTIYSKRRELYGLSQAKRAIAKEDKCFIVEGYADVISMHQAGFENVVASSGTALTNEQINAISRFTTDVTEMFDGDEAGIHAALRGVDMLLAQNLNIKVIVLPDDDDPDSFSRKHNHSEIQDFIAKNEEDFIRFKSRILLNGVEHDPIKRAAAIGDIIKSIAVIPNAITRSVYVQECAMRFHIAEEVLLREINKAISHNKEEERKRKQSKQNDVQADDPDTPVAQPMESQTPIIPTPARPESGNNGDAASANIQMQERNIINLIVKYGMCYLCDTDYDDGSVHPTTVVEYIRNEMELDALSFTTSSHELVYMLALNSLPEFQRALLAEQQRINEDSQQTLRDELAQIDPIGHNQDSMRKEEEAVEARINERIVAHINDFRRTFLERRLCSHPNDEVRKLACDIVSEPYQLSKIHTQYATIATEFDRLNTLVPDAINNWKYAIVEQQIKKLKNALDHATADEQTQLMEQMNHLYAMRRELAKITGERVVTP